VIPVPSFTVAEGVLWAPENSQVYARTNGFIEKIIASSGQQVQKGDLLIICENPELDTQVVELEARLIEYEARHRLSVTKDRTEAEILADEILRIREELQRKRGEKEDLLIRSSSEGTFLLPNSVDLPDRFIQRGTPVGHVVDFSKVMARVVVPQRNIDPVRLNTRRVVARLSESIDKEFPAVIKRIVPAASSDLPSLA
ncbi:MAG: HlyD family efflux transporter periplasmic adaptor subunit, partial [bacterium]|nr:HlyD family efflux transporter periplasmic adaptor subunit [bacterium]